MLHQYMTHSKQHYNGQHSKIPVNTVGIKKAHNTNIDPKNSIY